MKDERSRTYMMIAGRRCDDCGDVVEVINQ